MSHTHDLYMHYKWYQFCSGHPLTWNLWFSEVSTIVAVIVHTWATCCDKSSLWSSSFWGLGMVITPLIGNPYNGYINPYYLFPLPKSLNKVYQTCHPEMPNSNQLFFSTSPPFTTGWVRLGDPKRSWCIRFFHFSHSLGHCCLPTLLVCHLQLSHFFSGFILFHNGQWGRSFPNAIRWILCATHLVCCRSDLGSFQARIVDSHCASVFFFAAFFAC